MRAHERDNIERTLARVTWRIYGPGGAAELLGIAPTTLSSRIKRLKLSWQTNRSPTTTRGTDA